MSSILLQRKQEILSILATKVTRIWRERYLDFWHGIIIWIGLLFWLVGECDCG
jgi:hypothetical protein